MEGVALLVMSCDKYSSAWYPYFELIKKYWPDHPQKVYLSAETRSYRTAGLNVITINSNCVEPWSKRLYDVLNHISEEYVIFSLEDFFLLEQVDSKRIKECLRWMHENESIAEVRFSTFETIESGEIYKSSEFRICPREHKYRIDTQFALWRKSFLISILNRNETPWQFEGRASERSRALPDKLLWFSPTDPSNISTMIIPYYNGWTDGYGIGWGKWRPKNKQWFLQNGIQGVKYGELGTLSEKDIERRKKYLYATPTSFTRKIIKGIFQFGVFSDRIVRELLITGPQGLKNIASILKSRSN